MPSEERKITQSEGDEFRLTHAGQTADENGCVRPIVHQGTLLHEGSEKRPLYHTVRLQHDESSGLNHSGALVHRVDPANPVPLDMRHSTTEPVQMEHRVQPLAHQMGVRTTLQEPIHHALQLKTPLQLRFVNPWRVDSEYDLSLGVGGRTWMQISVRGRTLLSPQEPETNCEPSGEPRLRTMHDVVGRR